MDYDDNEFQRRNLPLAVESNNKYPSVLPPYALPKFDYDDSINGHLRFVSLVETEGFLGIEGDGDNNWIEDFSRGSSGAVFSSSAAESCAISRHNNVWSEATSSESVEMLLKSVGQDEVIVREDTIVKSETCAEQGCILKQMDPKKTCGDKSLSKEEEPANLQAIPSVDEKPGESCVSNQDVRLDQPLVDDALLTVSHESSVEGGNTITSSKTATGEATGIASLLNEPGEAGKMFLEQDKIGTEITECLLGKRGHDVSSEPRMEINCTDGTVENSDTTVAELNSHKASHLQNFNDANDISDCMQSSNDVCKDMNTDGDSVSVMTNLDGQVDLSSKLENVDAETIGDMAKPEMEPSVSRSFNDSETQHQNAHASSAHTSSTVETSLDFAGQELIGKNVLDEEKPEFLNRQSLVVASECKSSFQTATLADTRLVETSEVDCISTIDTMDESSQLIHVDEVTLKDANNEGSIHGPANLEQRIDLDCSACDVYHDTSSTQIIPEKPGLESFGNILEASASKATKLESQVDTFRGDISGPITDGQECQALPLNVDEFKLPSNKKTAAASVVSSADIFALKTSSGLTKKCCAFETEKITSCEPHNSQTFPTVAVAVCESSSQMDKLDSKHNNDDQLSPHNIEDSPSSTDGSKEAEARDDALRTMPPKPEETILEESHNTNFKNTPGMELILDKDIINEQLNASTLDNLGEDHKKDGHEYDRVTEIMDTVESGISTSLSEGDAIKRADPSTLSTFSEPCVESYVTGRENDITDSGNPSTSSHLHSKPSELPEMESDTGGQVVKIKDVSSDQISLTSDSTPLPDPLVKQAGEVSQAINPSEATLISPAVVGSLSTAILEKTTARTSKVKPEGKPRGTPKSAGKETSRKGNAKKEATLSRQLPSGGKTSASIQTLPSINLTTQSTEKQQDPHAETSAVKPFRNLASPISSLPDLNSSALPSLLQRSFTELQQVQLRAQILVYGALIQGMAPDEAYMISAFGGPYGGKWNWEKPWRACADRVQKLYEATPEMSSQSSAGSGGLDLVPRSALPGKVVIRSVSHTGSKEIPAVSPIIPLSSPLWSLTTPHGKLQSRSIQRGLSNDHQPLLSPMHAHPTPAKSVVGHNAHWISPSPYLTPRSISPQTNAFAEAVKLSPMKETSLPNSSAKHLQNDSAVQSGTSSSVVKGTMLFEPKGVAVASSQHSTGAKPKKQKKILVSEEPDSHLSNSQKQTESVASPSVTYILESSPFCATPNPVSNTITPNNPVSITMAPMNLASTFSLEKPSSSLASPTLSGNPVSEKLECKQRPVLSENAVTKLKEATRHAEEATTLAAEAVGYSQYVWMQVDQQKNAGFKQDIQGKLASAAVAVAAAAAVAKAAAGAANVAAGAALQAKLMAEESSISNQFDHGKELSTPAPVLKSDGVGVSSVSVLIAAKEAAKKRVEAATAASKRAENMDAIVKAAELAAEAVSQAGKLVSMGDPISLTQLLEADRDSYRGRGQVSEKVEAFRKGVIEKKEILSTSCTTSSGPRDASCLHGPVKSADGVSCSFFAVEKITEGHVVADLAKSNVILVPEAASKSSADAQSESKQTIETAKENGIMEGSCVEVLMEGPGLRMAWYCADVLCIKDGKAYVSYKQLSSEQGTEKLKEWVALIGDGDMPPKIRVARSFTAMPFEGTRKRRRVATEDAWMVGDRVDAWVHDSWWEGVIAEKSHKDETTLVVQFSVQGETLNVNSWNLRPSLVWKNGKWVDCPNSGANNSSLHEGDTLNEKRPRLQTLAREAEGKGTGFRNVDGLELGKLPQMGSLELDLSEKAFNIGWNRRDENKPNPNPLQMKRTGLQKHGSRVVFGVPKPGKKRKFMDVSKQYVSEGGSISKQPNEAANNNISHEPMIPPRERPTALPKPKVFKPKGTTASLARKEDSQNISTSNLEADDQTAKARATVSAIPNYLQYEESTQDRTALSMHDTLAVSSSRNTPSSMKVECTDKRRMDSVGGRLAKIEEGKVPSEIASKTSDGLEPRRSNRKIQPTSRLLEGLQTAMMVSKIPSVSHGKGQQNQSKSSWRGR